MIWYRSCNFCGATSFRVFRRLDLPFPAKIYSDAELACPALGQQLKLQYLECARCGLVCSNPLPAFAQINRRTYGGKLNLASWSTPDYDTYRANKLWAARLLEERYGFEQYRRENRILEICCGPGVSLQWLRDEKGWNVWGVDPDRQAVRAARELHGLAIHNGPADDAGVPDEYFDLAILDGALEFVFDPLGTLLAAFRFLRQGGALVLAVSNSDSLSAQYLHEQGTWGRWFLYRPWVLCDILGRIGYEVRRLVVEQKAKPSGTEPQNDELAVVLEGAAILKARETPCHGDWINLLAMKPESAAVFPAAEEELRALALVSLLERPTVTIAPAGPEAEASGGEALEPDLAIDARRTPHPAGALVPGRRFGQTFVCRKNGLARIEVLVATYAQAIPAGTLDLHLRDGTGAPSDLACVSIPAQQVRDNAYVALDVGPLDNSAGRTYYFYLEARDVPAGHAFTVWRSDRDIYGGGCLYLDGQPQAQDLCFRTYRRAR